MMSPISTPSSSEILGPISGSKMHRLFATAYNAHPALSNSDTESSIYLAMLENTYNILNPLTTLILGSVLKFLDKKDFSKEDPIQIKKKDILELQGLLSTHSSPWIELVRRDDVDPFNFGATHYLFTEAILRLRELSERNPPARELLEKREPLPQGKFIKHLLEANPLIFYSCPDYHLQIDKRLYAILNANPLVTNGFLENLSVAGILNNTIYDYKHTLALMGSMQSFINIGSSISLDSHSFLCILYLQLRDFLKVPDVEAEIKKVLVEIENLEKIQDLRDLPCILNGIDPLCEPTKLSECLRPSAYFASFHEGMRKTFTLKMNTFLKEWQTAPLKDQLLQATLDFCSQSGDMLYAYQSLILDDNEIQDHLFALLKKIMEEYRKERPLAPHQAAIEYLATHEALNETLATHLYYSWWYRLQPKKTPYDRALLWIAEDVLRMHPDETLEEQIQRLVSRFEALYPRYPNPRVDAELLLFQITHTPRQ